jgi:hypothetical protein
LPPPFEPITAALPLPVVPPRSSSPAALIFCSPLPLWEIPDVKGCPDAEPPVTRSEPLVEIVCVPPVPRG